jgi:hypothetical protein
MAVLVVGCGQGVTREVSTTGLGETRRRGMALVSGTLTPEEVTMWVLLLTRQLLRED